jgi:dolichyl-phosphate-mannose-protein mannosyltransferase
MEENKSTNTSKKILIIILLISIFLHLFRLDYPNAYVFDEVYHAFTAKEYLKGNIEAWEWWTVPPPGVAFEWTHPPLAKEIMTASMFIVNNTDAWAWRLPGALLGIISTYLMYLLGKKLFSSERIGLISAFLFTLEGLNFVQSRTGMNDMYLVTFILGSILMLLYRKFVFSAVFLGLASASKWSASYLLVINLILLFYFRRLRKIYLFILIPLIIYMLSYLPFFMQGHTFNQFIDFPSLLECQIIKIQDPCTHTYGLQNQMLSYHTNLKATHDYTSQAWSWPFNLYPVWYFVEYHQDGNTSNIFASGNPILFWIGFGAIIVSLWDYISLVVAKRKKEEGHETDLEITDNFWHLSRRDGLFVVLLGYFAFWLPWFASPRIMFLYHYAPSVPFLCLALAFQLDQIFKQKNQKIYFYACIGLIILGFLIVYPWLTGIALPKNIMTQFFNFNLAKNPFGS